MNHIGEALQFAVIFGFIWGMFYLKHRKRRTERELVHRERMLAMEKGIPLPELPVEENGAAAARYPDLLPKLSLGCGLLLVTGGVGMLVAFQFMRLPEADAGQYPSNLWAGGFIPLMLGFGFLIYYWLIRAPRR